MSETKLYTGILSPVNSTPLQLLRERGISEEEINSDKIEYIFEEHFYETHIILDGKVYKFDEKNETDYLDMCKIVTDTDGKVYYTAIFHNGGTCLSEVLEEAFKDD